MTKEVQTDTQRKLKIQKKLIPRLKTKRISISLIFIVDVSMPLTKLNDCTHSSEKKKKIEMIVHRVQCQYILPTSRYLCTICIFV